MRRGLVAAVTGLLLCLPTAALAQDADSTDEVGVGEPAAVERDPSAEQAEPEDQTGIGEPAAVECRGAVAAAVVDRDGVPVDGATLNVAGEQLAGSGTIESTCGAVVATLLAAPDGYAPAGPTQFDVQVRREDTTRVTFTVDEVQVLGTQFEQPAEAPAAPSAPATPAAPDTPEAEAAEAAPELPATGPDDAPTLLLAALACGLLGTVLVGFTSPTPARARRRG